MWSWLNNFLKGFENEKGKIKENIINVRPLIISSEYTGAGASHRSLVMEMRETRKSRKKWKITQRREEELHPKL